MPAKVVAHSVLQDPVKEHRQFDRRTVAVALRETQHRVLDDIQGSVRVADGEDRLLVRASLDALEER